MGRHITTAICPKCGVEHKVDHWFTGRGIPRKFCQICKISAELIHYSEEEYNYQTNIRIKED